MPAFQCFRRVLAPFASALAPPLALALSLALAPATAPLDAQEGMTGGEWLHHSGDLGATRYSSLDQIDRSNVDDLEIVWTRPGVAEEIQRIVPDLGWSAYFTSTPLMVDGVLYAPDGVGLIEAFDPATGETVWVEEPFEPGPEAYRGGTNRGAAFWSDGNAARILHHRGHWLISLDARTGRPDPEFGEGGRVDLGSGDEEGTERYRWGGAPTVVGDVVVMGRAMSDFFSDMEGEPGDVRAFDVRTGELRWTFHTVPRAGELGTGSWGDGSWAYSGHAPVWATFAADPELGLVYMPVSSTTADMYGGHRPGDNLFSQSLVAVDAETGERVWHYQLVHHGLWDYDPPAAPILVDVEVDGREIPAVVQLTKQALAFVFDRETGEPVWPIEERPVPRSTVPGEVTSPTQPFPTRPPPFDRIGATEENLIDFTPELRAEALEIVSRYTLGPLFTPPSVRTDDNLGTIQLPGSQGGANIQGGAFDPGSGYLFIPSITSAFVADLLPGDPEEGNLRYVQGSRMWIAGPRGLPLFKPPYGRITAVDMSTGEIVWQVANGEGPRDHPAIAHLDLPRLGFPGRPSPLATRSLLFIGEGSDAFAGGRARTPEDMPLEISTNYGEPWFRAYDKETGELIWETELPAGVTGAPITYMYQNRQYIVMAVGSRQVEAHWVALALP